MIYIENILAVCAAFIEKYPWKKDYVLIVRFDEVEKCIYGFKPKDAPLATDTLVGLYAVYPEGNIYKLCPAYANHPAPYWKEIKTTFTNEELLDAIREAYSLEELQRMVGPSEEESQRNRLRDKTLGNYYKGFGSDHNKWPEYAKDLLVEQGQFEAKYL